MVRYIKDGAYTIVVDDNASHDGDAPPDTARSHTSKQSRPPTTGPSGQRPSVRRTSILRAVSETEEEEEEVISDDDIDYTSSEFILQNLKCAVPSVDADSTHILLSRKDVSEMIVQQVCFYVYCLLHAHLNRAESPTIIHFGDGYIGSKIIQRLASCSCTPFLRLYCRGEVSAKEWRERGFLADNNIVRLLGGESPTIIILSADYYSFHHIYHLLTENHLVVPETAIISTTLGFQRKKLYYNFSVPTILRTYVEPGDVLASHRTIAEQRASMLVAKALQGQTLAEGDGEDETSEQNSADGRGEGSKLSDHSDDESSISENVLTETEKAAIMMADRMCDIRNLLYIVENFYALQDMAHDEARRVALRAITGFADSSTSSQGKKSQALLMKKERLVIKLLEKAILQLYSSTALKFHQEWSRRLSLDELNKFAKEYVIEQKIDSSLSKFQDEKNIRHLRRQHRPTVINTATAAAAEAVAVVNSPKSVKSSEKGSKVAHSEGGRSGTPPKASVGSLESSIVSSDTVSTGHNRNAFVVDQGKHHFTRNGKGYHPMHETSAIYDSFNIDDDYSNYEGPGFAYMRQLDEGDRRKSMFKGASVSKLRIFFNEENKPSENGVVSPSAMSPLGSARGIINPSQFRRVEDPNSSPLRTAHRNAATNKP